MLYWLRTPAGLVTLSAGAIAWAYSGVLGVMISTWWRIADYSHGFFVVPVAGYLAWHARKSIPRHLKPSYGGVVLVGLALVACLLGTLVYIKPLQEYSLVLAVAGMIVAGGGWRLLRWSAVPVAYLLFMIPLPHDVARTLATPLQYAGAAGSAFLLQAAQVPALAQGTEILLPNTDLNVAFACSGLQMIISFGAVCVAIAMLSDYRWFGRLIISLSAIPIAIVANIFRIALIGWAAHMDLAPPAQLHDAGGILIVPVTIATVLVGIVLFEKCFPRRHPSAV